MFLARENELRTLEDMYNREGFQMAVVYGRRRIGKTSLLNEFIKGKNALYLPAEEVNDSLNLKKFSRLFGEKLGLSSFPAYENWNEFLAAIGEKLSNQRVVIVIDEYPYAATANKSLNSILQHTIDYNFKNTNLFLILCGSSVSFMESQVLGEKSPLFGRRTGQLKLGPLDYLDASRFYPNVPAEDKVKYYACIGGTPYYLSLIDEKQSFEENVKSLYFNIGGYLFNEGTLLMKQEFREPANYNAVLQAIAAGHVTLSEITQFTKQETNIVSKYLLTLQDLHIVERIIPFGANPLRGKTSQYRIIENFLSFWYKYVFSVRSEIERGYGELYFDYAMETLNSFVGVSFEEVCRQYLRRLNSQRQLPFRAVYFGRWWGKDRAGLPQEVDIVAESMDGRALILGECKWRNSIDKNQVEQAIFERAELFDKYEKHLFLFTKKEQKTDKPIRCITAEEMFSHPRTITIP